MLAKNTAEASDTKDTLDDLSIFMLDCNYLSHDDQFNYYELNRSDYVITQVAYPDSCANVRFTPRRTLIRHGDHIRSMCHRLDSEQITHVTGKKTIRFVVGVVRQTTRTAKRTTAINITDLADEIFFAVYLHL
jgi:hypothetical protein